MPSSNRAFKASITSLTSCSGAEAPAVIPSVWTPSSLAQGISAARSISSELVQPARSATSTSRTEFDEFGAPMTNRPSSFGAIALTAACRLVVA
jgi:hypothetical protein